MTKRFSTSRMVNFADCDPAGIVFYPRFYEWFDRGTEMLFRSVGIEWEKLFGSETPEGIMSGMPLVDTSARFMYPCRFGDTIEIESFLEEVHGRTFIVRHHVYNGGIHACEGREVRVWALSDSSRESGLRVIPVPARVLAKFD